MVRRLVGRAASFAALAFATLALAVPAAASATDTEVLVVVSADKGDGLSKAGLDAIRSAGRSAGFSVTAPSSADVGDQFTVRRLERYSAVVFLNTGAASPLTGAQQASFE